ncbi:MAG: hypothetical protein FWD23_19250, partial [Oscillospiraceae bacterium]|nr:hypothetical protein [Oscillospiraceae bacterium]
MNENDKTGIKRPKRIRWEFIAVIIYIALACAILMPPSGSEPEVPGYTEYAGYSDYGIFIELITTETTEVTEVTENITELIITTEPTTESATEPPTAPPTSPPPTPPPTEAPTAPPRRVIREGDIIIGEATHYAVCCECDEPNSKLTASESVIQNGVQCFTATCNWLPFGTIIEVNGVQYTIRDRGGRWFNTIGNIDIFVPEGQETALRIGRLKNIEIKIVHLPG